jgi:WhiB family redox-sensing transcriptional regulator
MRNTALRLAESQASCGEARSSQAWRRLASCSGLDPEIWYPIGTDGADAIAICSQCSVRIDCLEWALEHNERDGIWGGVSARRRQRIRSDARIRSSPRTVTADVQRLPSGPASDGLRMMASSRLK